MEQKYPFKGWVLGGTFIPKQVELLGHQHWYGEDWYSTATGKDYRFFEVFGSKEEVISYGRRLLVEQEARIAKQQAGLAKKLANLNKHS